MVHDDGFPVIGESIEGADRLKPLLGKRADQTVPHGILRSLEVAREEWCDQAIRYKREEGIVGIPLLGNRGLQLLGGCRSDMCAFRNRKVQRIQLPGDAIVHTEGKSEIVVRIPRLGKHVEENILEFEDQTVKSRLLKQIQQGEEEQVLV